MLVLSALHRYPIKSGAAESLSAVEVAEEGLVGDRRFMVVRPDGSFVTARRHAGLQRVVARFDGTCLSVEHDDWPALRVRRVDFGCAPVATGVWGDTFDAWTTTDALDAWMSRVLGETVRLLWAGASSSRYRAKLGIRVSLADGYPLLLTTEASLADLNARTDGSHVMGQFRPNVVIAGTAAYAEDDWRRVRIGAVVFRIAEPCARCVMITVDPTTGARRPDGEPLKTLGRYRKQGKDILFGVNLIAESAGRIARGDDVEVLE